jgi:SDR family mycofactocin-dependent oxidoreductase
MPEYDFNGKVAFVTGAARGQGRSHALKYAEHGADVVAVDICHDKETIPAGLGTREQLDSVVADIESLGQRGLAIEADVADEQEVRHAVQTAVDSFGKIDFLANNAGIGDIAELVEMDEQAWDELLDTALKGPWLCSKHVGQHMIERGGGGKIISTSSAAGLLGQPGIGHYVSAKHGLLGLTKTLALELAEHDINVNAVCPGAVDTPMIEGWVETRGEESLERMMEFSGVGNVLDPGGMMPPEDVSEAYMWLSSDASRYVTGIALPIDAGYTAK